MDDVEALAVGAAIDGDVAGLIGGDAAHDGRELVCCVGAEPGTSRVRAAAMSGNTQADGALTTGLHHGAGGLAQQRKIAPEPLRVVLLQVAQAIKFSGYFFALVGDDGEVML